MISFIICILSICCLCACGTHKSNMPYSKEIIDSLVEEYRSDLDSNLSIFPQDIYVDDQNSTFFYQIDSGLFDIDGQIILSSHMNKEQFNDEISRLSKLSMTITYENESFTNDVLYDDQSYPYPAYITIDGFGDTYEYALIDESNHTITYIYLAYPDIQDASLQGYLKKDLHSYDINNSFSMYNHSFENGKSWIEFDD